MTVRYSPFFIRFTTLATILLMNEALLVGGVEARPGLNSYDILEDFFIHQNFV